MEFTDQEAVISLVRSLFWAGFLLVIVLLIVPMIKFCVNRFCMVREKEIELERRQLEYQIGQTPQPTPNQQASKTWMHNQHVQEPPKVH